MFDLNLTSIVFLVMFFAFVFAFNNMVLKPVGLAIEQRQRKCKTDIEAGKAARTEAAAIVENYQARIHEARVKAQSNVNDVIGAAQKRHQAELKKVVEQGQKELDQAKQSIASEKSSLIDRLAEEQQVLVATIVKKLLGDSPSALVDVGNARKVLMEEAS